MTGKRNARPPRNHGGSFTEAYKQAYAAARRQQRTQRPRRKAAAYRAGMARVTVAHGQAATPPHPDAGDPGRVLRLCR